MKLPLAVYDNKLAVSPPRLCVSLNSPSASSTENSLNYVEQSTMSETAGFDPSETENTEGAENAPETTENPAQNSPEDTTTPPEGDAPRSRFSQVFNASRRAVQAARGIHRLNRDVQEVTGGTVQSVLPIVRTRGVSTPESTNTETNAGDDDSPDINYSSAFPMSADTPGSDTPGPQPFRRVELDPVTGDPVRDQSGEPELPDQGTALSASDDAGGTPEAPTAGDEADTSPERPGEIHVTQEENRVMAERQQYEATVQREQQRRRGRGRGRAQGIDDADDVRYRIDAGVHDTASNTYPGSLFHRAGYTYDQLRAFGEALDRLVNQNTRSDELTDEQRDLLGFERIMGTDLPTRSDSVNDEREVILRAVQEALRAFQPTPRPEEAVQEVPAESVPEEGAPAAGPSVPPAPAVEPIASDAVVEAGAGIGTGTEPETSASTGAGIDVDASADTGTGDEQRGQASGEPPADIPVSQSPDETPEPGFTHELDNMIEPAELNVTPAGIPEVATPQSGTEGIDTPSSVAPIADTVPQATAAETSTITPEQQQLVQEISEALGQIDAAVERLNAALNRLAELNLTTLTREQAVGIERQAEQIAHRAGALQQQAEGILVRLREQQATIDPYQQQPASAVPGQQPSARPGVQNLAVAQGVGAQGRQALDPSMIPAGVTSQATPSIGQAPGGPAQQAPATPPGTTGTTPTTTTGTPAPAGRPGAPQTPAGAPAPQAGQSPATRQQAPGAPTQQAPAAPPTGQATTGPAAQAQPQPLTPEQQIAQLQQRLAQMEAQNAAREAAERVAEQRRRERRWSILLTAAGVAMGVVATGVLSLPVAMVSVPASVIGIGSAVVGNNIASGKITEAQQELANATTQEATAKAQKKLDRWQKAQKYLPRIAKFLGGVAVGAGIGHFLHGPIQSLINPGAQPPTPSGTEQIPSPNPTQPWPPSTPTGTEYGLTPRMHDGWIKVDYPQWQGLADSRGWKGFDLLTEGNGSYVQAQDRVFDAIQGVLEAHKVPPGVTDSIMNNFAMGLDVHKAISTSLANPSLTGQQLLSQAGLGAPLQQAIQAAGL